MLAKMKLAMPDGSYYIRNGSVGASDLDNAINAVGRATGKGGVSDEEQRNAVRRHIITRAKALHLESKIPDTWNSDGTLKHSVSVEDFLMHFGVKGMKWGVRRSKLPASPDAARASALKKQVKSGGGTHSLSNEDLRHLVTRLNLETQYAQLSDKNKASGQKFLDQVLVESKGVAKQAARDYAKAQAPKVAAYIAKQAVSSKK